MSETVFLVIGIGGIFVGLLVLLVALGVGERERVAVGRSLAAIDALDSAPADLRKHELDRSFSDRVLEPSLKGLANLGRRFTPAAQADRIARRLQTAGSPEGWTVDRVIALKVVGALVLGPLSLLTMWLLFESPVLTTVLVAGGVTVFGFFLPNILLINAAKRRQEQIQRELADALDLLTISVEAGLAFDAAMAQVARNTEGPLAEEFFRTLSEMQIGRTRSEALSALGDRCGVDELSAFTTAMVQADSFGIPISNVLRVQAKEMRVKRRQRAEERAMKVPVKIIIPVVLCIFPVLIMVIIGPGAISIFRELLPTFG